MSLPEKKSSSQVRRGRPKSNDLVMTRKGIRMGDISLGYPIIIGKLKSYNRYNNLAVELDRRGDRFYLNIYDKTYGMIAMGRISRLDAEILVKERLKDLGEIKSFNEKKFRDKIKSFQESFIM